MEKTLAELGLEKLVSRAGHWGDEPRFSGLCVDSRDTLEGFLFCAMPGSEMHGAEFAKFARRMGAVAVLTDQAGLDILDDPDYPVLLVADARLALSHAAARWFGVQPRHMVAITGTNGKTSVANFHRQILENLGRAAVNFGTVGVEGAVSAKLSHTTPEPITLHRLLAELVAKGVTHAAMEASSHGLEQRRLDGVMLEAAAFTNLSRDHLDYHHTFGDYFAAKAGLFERVLPVGATAVINMDDSFGPTMKLVAEGRGQRVISLGVEDGCDMRILNQRYDSNGQDIRYSWQGEVFTTRLSLIGGFQAANALMAAALAIALGEAPAEVFGVLPALKTVRGRMELAATRKNGATVFVDFAHTPEALEIALKALRPHVLGRLIAVFGAGGDRDKGKRPLMGAAAMHHADVVFVTDDNPRTEEAATIRAEVLAGCPEAYEVGDRAEAILRGVDALQPGDTLLIAGKGHENGQIIGTDVFPFDDAEQASVAVAALEGRL
ncbi:MAG: UDP-N-acetylmuramoyl-L-alanyl-D-glutamate--2,6-diaminopimelate ligase [Rhodobacteraceae bacterium]|nr:UDP-N-acetylmuramoyl-L-alanyl-D-glutamate--2,6-diaminopimelate ligase [Paracoccaceae bacterium]